MESQTSIDPCIPITLSSYDLMDLFDDKIPLIRDKSHKLLTSHDTNLASNTEMIVKPGYLSRILFYH